MSVTTGVIIFLMLAYAAVVIGIGRYAQKRTGVGRSEYYVGGTLSSFVIFFTYLATFFSAYGFIRIWGCGCFLGLSHN